VTAPLSSWRDRAACRSYPAPEVFDTDELGSPDWIEATGVCWGCRARSECLGAALARHPFEDAGIWGGTTRSERADMRGVRR
jgi:hypothetical protein